MIPYGVMLSLLACYLAENGTNVPAMAQVLATANTPATAAVNAILLNFIEHAPSQIYDS